jgi:uncharacterized protein YtpQ (UPF0354 family)
MGMDRRGILAMGLFSAFAAWWPAKAKPRSFASVAEFRQYIMTVIRQRHLAEHVVADPADPAKFSMKVNGDTASIHVTNIYGYITAYPEENTDEAVERFIKSITEPQNKPVDDENILAVIRSREYVEAVGQEVLHEQLGADLVILYMADRPDSMVPIRKTDVPGKDLASVRTTALDNVRKWLPKVVADGQLGAGTLYYVEGNTMLSTSLILLDDFWKSVAARFPGDVLIALPRKDQLFLFDDDGSANSRAAVRRLIDATIEENFNLLSPQLYARRGGKVVAVSD